MAFVPNANSPQGLVPRMHRNGEPYSGSAREYYVPATDANPMFIGDPVVVTGTSDANGIPAVTLATAGANDPISGVIVGFSVRSLSSMNLISYRPAGLTYYPLIADNPDLLFEIQASAGFVAANVSDNVNLLAGAGNTGNGISGWQADSTSFGTGAGLQLRVLRVENRADVLLGPNNVKLQVAINLHTQAQPSAGV